MTGTNTYVYSRADAEKFLSDNMRNALRDIIREHGHDPSHLMNDWALIERGIRAWLESGHLTAIHIEFYKPGASEATTRWDFPIKYSGSGVDDDMWLDKTYLRQLIEKAPRPTADCVYRILLGKAANAPTVLGFSDTTFLSTGQLSPRSAGTIVATGHMTASATYWTK